MPISLTTFGNDVDENFNSLANSGTSSALPAGWETNRPDYSAGNGTIVAGGIRSYGNNGQVDRALGSLTNNGQTPLMFGAAYINDTGGTITELDIQYTGEQWRRGANNSVDTLAFEYSLDANSITDGAATWVAVNSLNFNSPNVSATAAALNGNLVANRAAVGDTITGLSISNGSDFYIRYVDSDITGGNDHGLAIDNFQITPDGVAPVPAPASLLMLLLGLGGLLYRRRISD